MARVEPRPGLPSFIKMGYSLDSFGILYARFYTWSVVDAQPDPFVGSPGLLRSQTKESLTSQTGLWNTIF